MAIRFNPLIFSGFDLAASAAGAPTWAPTIGTEAALPTVGNTDGDVRVTLDTDNIWVWNVPTSRWILDSVRDSATLGSSPNAIGYSIADVNVSTNRTERQFQLQPADGTNPGVITAGTQTIGGDKTFSGNISANNLSGTNTGNISLAAIGSTPNANGATLTSQQLNLEPANTSFGGIVTNGTQTLGGDKTFNNDLTVNGELLVQGGSIDRDTLGTITIGGVNTNVINIGNSSATVNLIGDVNIENVTNLDVDSKLITINHGGGAGSGSNTGLQVEENSIITGYATTSADRNSWTIKAPNTAGIATITPGAGGITLNQSSHDPVTVSDTATVDLTLTGQVLSADVIEAGLTLNNIGGTLGVGKGGTGVGTTPTSGQLLIGNGTGYTVATLTAGSNISITNGVGTISIASGSTGDISQTSFSAANNQSSPASVTGFLFSNASVRSFKAQVSVSIDATGDLFEVFDLLGVQKSASWSMSQVSTGDESGVDFSITTLGQVQYTSTSVVGFVSDTMKFRAEVLNV